MPVFVWWMPGVVKPLRGLPPEVFLGYVASASSWILFQKGLCSFCCTRRSECSISPVPSVCSVGREERRCAEMSARVTSRGGGYEEKGILMFKCSVCHLSTCLVSRTANVGCRISTMVYVRVEAWVELVANVGRMRSSVGRARRSSPVVHIRVVPGVDLVANV